MAMKEGETALDDLARQLLDFSRAPGRYAVRLGEPGLLFSRLDTVAQWALGRFPDSLAAEYRAQAAQLAAAAVLFIQRACFAPDNTHYQVLGLTSKSFSAELLRTRYRALIRLTHPDMGITSLPADAAGMVNRALDVLSDDASRQHYDEQLRGSHVPPAPAAAASAGWSPRTGPSGRRPVAVLPANHSHGLRERWQGLIAQYPRQWHMALVAVAILVPVGGLLLWTAQDSARDGALVASRRAAAGTPGETAPHAVTARGTDGPASSVAPTSRQPAPARVAQESAAPPPVHLALSDTLSSPMPASTQSRAEAVHSASRAPVPMPSVAVAQAEARSKAPGAAEAAPAPTAVQSLTVPPSPPAVRSVPEPAPAPSTAHSLATIQPEAAPPVPPLPAPIWSVDAEAARDYVGDIVATLDSASRARQLQSYLVGMKVKGNLLRPATELLARYPDNMTVRRSGWSEEHRPGVVRIRSMVVLQPPTAEEAYTYRLLAEFRGTEQGTMLMRLDLGAE
jgi:hypothetical protein